jgi:hypothetical protein
MQFFHFRADHRDKGMAKQADGLLASLDFGDILTAHSGSRPDA